MEHVYDFNSQLIALRVDRFYDVEVEFRNDEKRMYVCPNPPHDNFRHVADPAHTRCLGCGAPLFSDARLGWWFTRMYVIHENPF